MESAPAYVATAVSTAGLRREIHADSVDFVQGFAQTSAWLAAALPTQHLDPNPFTGKVWKVNYSNVLRSKHARSNLSSLLQEKTYALGFAEANARQRALMLTLRATGAGVVLTLRPNAGEGTCLPPRSFKRALKYHSGVPLFPRGTRRTTEMVCAFCGDMMDVYGDHVSTCRSAGTSTRHNKVRDKNAHQLQRAAFHFDMEPLGLVKDAKRPADVLVKLFSEGKDAWIDHTVTGPFSATLLKGSSEVHNFALAAAEMEKNCERRGALQAAMDLGALYLPFALTTVGGIGTPGLRVLRAIASKTAQSHRVAFSDQMAMLVRELAVTVHRGNNALWEEQDLFFNPLPGADRWRSRRRHKWGKGGAFRSWC